MRERSANQDEPATRPGGAAARPRPRRRRLLRAGAALAGTGALAAWLTQTPPLERIDHFAARTPSIIAHAGAQGHAPPNTLEAFALALELGADTLEMDLQLSADGEVVVIHNGTVDATTDGRGAVADLTVAELRRLDAGWRFTGPDGGHPFRGRGVRIPTLEEVFTAFPEAFMILEMKPESGPRIVEAVADMVVRHDRADRVVVASFELDYLRRFRELLPGVPTSMAEDEVRTFYVLHRLGLHRWWRPPGVLFQVPEYHEDTHVVTPRFTRAAGQLGIDVHVWTVNEPADLRRMLDAGAHGIITDYPDRLARLLGRA